MTGFQIAPRGPFSLEAAAGFGFGGTIGAPVYDGAMRLAFAVDGFAQHAGVLLREHADGTIAEPGPGLTEEQVARLHGVAEAALAGVLEPQRLRALEPNAALAELLTLRGIGPFYAALILVRASGFADVTAPEPRMLESAARLYGLDGPPDADAFEELSRPWRPFRTWAIVLLRVAAGHATRR